MSVAGPWCFVRVGTWVLAAAGLLLWCASAALGVVLLPRSLPVCAFIAVAAAALTWLLLRDRDAVRDRLAIDPLRGPLVVGALTAALSIAAVGTVALLGGAAGALLLVPGFLGVACWRGIQLRLRLRASPVGPGAGVSGLAGGRTSAVQVVRMIVAEPDPASMTTAELCQAWPGTYHRLQQAHDAVERDHVVHLRRRLLDELEHRDATGFAAWIGSGAGPFGDPRHYLNADHRRTDKDTDSAG